DKARVTLNSKATRDALKFGRDLFKKGESNEIFAWTAASNNQGMLAGRLSLALNAISIPRSAESTNPDLAKNIGLLPIPAGPNGRLGLEHVMHTYMIWKFASNKKMAVKFLVELELKYRGAFVPAPHRHRLREVAQEGEDLAQRSGSQPDDDLSAGLAACRSHASRSVRARRSLDRRMRGRPPATGATRALAQPGRATIGG